MNENHRKKIDFAFLNAGHFFDHFIMLIFASVAVAIATDRQVDIPGVSSEWDLSYSDLIPYSVAGFVAFGLFSVPAAWLADKWSRPGMIVIFFLGMGFASIIAAFATSIVHLAALLFLVGIFGAIYHPVGIAMVIQGRDKTGMAIAMNGVFGNLGVAGAPIVTLLFIELFGWRMAFALPGAACALVGFVYLFSLKNTNKVEKKSQDAAIKRTPDSLEIDKKTLIRIFTIIFFSAALGSFIFQSTTFALPKIFDERLAGFVSSGREIGWWSFIVFTIASVAQLIVGYLVDNHSVRVVFSAVAGIQAALFALMLNLTGLPALIVSIGFMLVVFGQIPINDVLIGRITKSEWRSRAYSIRYIISFFVMAVAVPAVSSLHGNWGFHALFALMSVLASLIFCAVLFLPSARLKTQSQIDQ
ncbi:MAG: hypothetical protein CBB68_07640 [Rhodospirillaceae bacterium TMED8]|nr:MFS transporter [Magnetovibrio sp.]OUT50855.1 MAG: hypothetical protein CBB68_07640 [Rhodospirillaceae bacterium TMED8]|tara:strand:- start:1347 stop:2591 length:1245 start_codon:yes stop_codon:yes gene_type:complete